ncbi:hypothetical protein LZ32DRAFT_387791 [Colletotrichum eremochloae]|nr:hypothetical protein LZ32DRAFT_387791 [Colletotrichum eremochloae]
MSSLSRAFTTRRVKNSIDLSDAARGKDRTNIMQRSKTTKAQPVMRHKISAPMELVHTTNMLSYSAPDIRPRAGTDTSSNSSRKSTEEDSESAKSAASSPPTSPDVASHELTKEPNHLSCYFVAPGASINKSKTPEAPIIPKRAPTHTKQASYDAVARQRSLSQMSKASDKTVSSKASMTFSRASSGSSAASTMSHHSTAPAIKTSLPPMPSPAFQHQTPRQEKRPESHPFGRELAQVTEIAEEFGIKGDVMYEEECLLKAEGLYKFAADDYLSEVQSLFPKFFTDSHAPQSSMATAWI